MNIQQLTSIIALTLVLSGVKAQNVLAPQPVYPAQKALVREKLPVFTWVPSLGVNLAQDPQYEFKMVQVHKGQTPEAAILSNPDFYRVKTSQNLLSYPLAAPKLEDGKKYAWQLTLFYNAGRGEVVSKKTLPGEVYEFTIAPLRIEKCVPMLVEKPDERFYLIKDYDLLFEFDSTMAIDPTGATYQITDSQGQQAIIERIVVETTETPRYFLVKLNNYIPFRRKSSRNDLYTLEARTKDQRTYKLKFTCE